MQAFYERPKTLDPLAERNEIIKTAGKLILNEIKSIDAKKKFYPNPTELMSKDSNLIYVPGGLQLFLRTIFSEKNVDIKISSIGQAVIQAARPRVLIAPLQIGLGVQVHHHFASKFLVDTLDKLGFSSSYTEVQKFEVSAAATLGAEIPKLTNGQFGQFVADNVDHNLRTLDGHNTFHGMGIIGCITPGVSNTKAVQRLSANTEDLAALGKIEIQYYRQEHNFMATKTFETLPQFEGFDPSRRIDILYKTMTLKPSKPGWSGMMQMVHTGSYPGQSSVTFLPMIDMNPSDMSCIYSTLSFVCKQAEQGSPAEVLNISDEACNSVYRKCFCIF